MNCLPALTAQRPRWRANGAALLQGLAQCAFGWRAQLVARMIAPPPLAHELPRLGPPNRGARRRKGHAEKHYPDSLGAHPGYACGERVAQEFNASW